TNVFVRDLVAGTTTLVSINQQGTATGNQASTLAAFTPDGQRVAFRSTASDLVSGDTNFITNVFVRNVPAGTTTLVSVNQAGTGGGNASSDHAVITPDGRYVFFDSNATNLVSGDNNNAPDVFRRDLFAGTT